MEQRSHPPRSPSLNLLTRINMNYVPFVYLLKFLPTGELYYGSRTGKKSHPADLWNRYFSSSKIVKKLIKEHGKDSFEYEIRKTFETKEEALEYEHRFLKRVNAKKNPKFLNKTNGAKNFIGNQNGSKASDKTRLKMSKSALGRAKTEECRYKLGVCRLGKELPEHIRATMRKPKGHMSEANKESRRGPRGPNKKKRGPMLEEHKQLRRKPHKIKA